MAVDITVTTRSRGKITGKLQLDKDHSVVFATARARKMKNENVAPLQLLDFSCSLCFRLMVDKYDDLDLLHE